MNALTWISFSFKLVLILTIILEVSGIKPITCKDGNLFGTEDLVDTVHKTINECSSSTSSKADLFGCVYKQLKGPDDAIPMSDKIKSVLEKVHSRKIMEEARNLIRKLMDCADKFADSFNTGTDLGVSSNTFKNCFLGATNAFVAWAKTECQAQPT